MMCISTGSYFKLINTGGGGGRGEVPVAYSDAVAWSQ